MVATTSQDDDAYGTDEFVTIGTVVNTPLRIDAMSIVSKPNRIAIAITVACTSTNTTTSAEDGAKWSAGAFASSHPPCTTT